MAPGNFRLNVWDSRTRRQGRIYFEERELSPKVCLCSSPTVTKVRLAGFGLSSRLFVLIRPELS
jgi:hypothetical protein